MLIRSNTHMSNEMSAQEEQAWLHFLSGDPMFRNFVKAQASHGVDPRRQIARQEICPRCERPAFHHQSGITCNHCGYTGPKTISARIYIKEGWYK